MTSTSSIDILKRLHQRPPYLMVDKVIDHGADFIVTQKSIEDSHQIILGHFPNSPIIPGAILQEMTTQAAGLLISEYHSPVVDYDSSTHTGHALGVLRAVHGAKFRNFVRPNDLCEVHVKLIDQVDHVFRFKAEIFVKGIKVMNNEFSLMNIPSSHLANV